MNRLFFLIGRRRDRTRGRLRAAQDRKRLDRESVSAVVVAPVDAPTAGGTFAVISHPADDFLFFSTTIVRDAEERRRVLTVHLTAGDDDEDSWYWQAREAGVRAAYAALYEVADRWVVSTLRVTGKRVTKATLAEAPWVSLIFLRLPDGRPDGNGGARNSFTSLRKLWEGDITTLSAVDESASHSLTSLQELLRALLAEFAPDRIVTTDHLGEFGDGDHSDHHVAGYLADLIHGDYAHPHEFIGFRGDETERMPANLEPDQIELKRRLFFVYAPFDYKTPQTVAKAENVNIGAWLTREYAV